MREHQRNNNRNLKFGRHYHKHALKNAYRGIFSKITAQHHTRIANQKRSKQQRGKIAEKRRMSTKKTKRKHLHTPCHHNCLGLYLRMNARPLKQQGEAKHSKTFNIERIEKITSHPKKLFDAQDDNIHSSYRHTKHKGIRSRHKLQRYSPFKRKKRINRKNRKRNKCRSSTNLCKHRLAQYAVKHRKSEFPKVSEEHRRKLENVKSDDYRSGLRLKVRQMNRRRSQIQNKIRDERTNEHKKQSKNTNGANMKSSIKNDSTPAVLCEHNKKKMREMIIKMNKAVRRSIILAKIIGKKFGIDDKTIEAILRKEEEKINPQYPPY
jgi:hypothetical protein